MPALPIPSCIRLFPLLLLPVITVQAQTRIEKTGSNTWGGAYVPPKWVKTYDQTLKNYNINVQSYRSDNRSTGGNTGSSGSGYTPRKSKWASIYKEEDYERQEAGKVYKSKKAKEIILSYAIELNDRINDYKAGFYRPCYNGITRILPQITTKGIKEFDNADEVYGGTMKYYEVKNYYEYMSGVKAGATYPAVVLYNLHLSADYDFKNRGDGKRPDVREFYPFTADHYYFLGNQDGSSREGFSRYSIGERFMADLFLVELLVDIDKKEEAKRIFQAVLKFYLPRIAQPEPFLRQIAINHFYLGNTQEASDLLEFYWNETESYDDRLQVLNELVVGDGFQQKNKWSRENYPEGYAFVKRNFLFLDSIHSARNLKIEGLNEGVKFYLYINRGKEYDFYLSGMEARMQQPFDSLYANTHGFFNSYNPEVERYLRVLLMKGDKDKIRETLGRVAAVARKQQAYFQKQVDSNIDKLDEYKHAPQLYWEAWYNRKAEPAERALNLFKLEKFAEEGGKKYLREAAQPFMEEAENYTVKEFSYNADNLEACGIKPNFLKKRSYPDQAPPSKKELQEAAERKQREQETLNRIQGLESRKAEAARIPLSPEEARLNSAGPPFGGLAIFEQSVKGKAPARGKFYDSATIDFASICFARAGYEKGKSIRADILMASAAKDKAEIMQYLGGWKAEQLLDTWYPGGIKTADQVPAGDDGVYEQQFIQLLRLAGSYEQLYTYVGKTSWKTAIKFAIEHAEAMAVSGKFKEAFIFIENFSNYTGATRDKFIHWDRAVMMRAIVHFHKKEYKESWVHLNDYHVNMNELLASSDKWKASLCGTAYSNPGIFIHDDYAYYYYCCASELKKKNILPDCLPLIDIPPTAPDWMVKKYGALFVKGEKQ